MDFLRPASWEEALAAKAEHPTAVPIAGGTDVMVEINFDHRRPEYLLDLNRIGDLSEWEVGEESVRLGASVPYTKIMENLRAELPGLALASHTVASPQIRNRGEQGGVGVTGRGGGAEVAADELIRAVHVKKADGPQQFSKVGTRNAMVIAVCAFGLALHPGTRTVRTGIGSAAPTPVRAKAAEEFLNAALEEGGFWDNGQIITPSVAKQFADLCSAACNPIDDVRGTASYRRHAVGVMARRTLTWTWESYRGTRRLTEGAA